MGRRGGVAADAGGGGRGRVRARCRRASGSALLHIRQRLLVHPPIGLACAPVPSDADRRGPRVGARGAARRLPPRVRARRGRDPFARTARRLRVRAHPAAASPTVRTLRRADDSHASTSGRAIASSLPAHLRWRGARARPHSPSPGRSASTSARFGRAQLDAAAPGERLMRILFVAHRLSAGIRGRQRDLRPRIWPGAAAAARRRGAGADARGRRRARRVRRPDGAARRLTVAGSTTRSADVRRFEDTYRNERLAAVASGVIDDFAPDVAHIHHLTCLSTEIVARCLRERVPVRAHAARLLADVPSRSAARSRRRVCDGPGAGGCGRCVGAAARRRPRRRALRAALPAVASPVARRLAPLVASRRAASDEERRRVEHMRGVFAHVTRLLAPSRAIRDRFVAFGIPRTHRAVARTDSIRLLSAGSCARAPIACASGSSAA